MCWCELVSAREFWTCCGTTSERGRSQKLLPQNLQELTFPWKLARTDGWERLQQRQAPPNLWREFCPCLQIDGRERLGQTLQIHQAEFCPRVRNDDQGRLAQTPPTPRTRFLQTVLPFGQVMLSQHWQSAPSLAHHHHWVGLDPHFQSLTSLRHLTFQPHVSALQGIRLSFLGSWNVDPTVLKARQVQQRLRPPGSPGAGLSVSLAILALPSHPIWVWPGG